jgi:hypothetical protein
MPRCPTLVSFETLGAQRWVSWVMPKTQRREGVAPSDPPDPPLHMREKQK